MTSHMHDHLPPSAHARAVATHDLVSTFFEAPLRSRKPEKGIEALPLTEAWVGLEPSHRVKQVRKKNRYCIILLICGV